MKHLINYNLAGKAAKLLGASTEDKDIQRAACKLALAADTFTESWDRLRELHAINEPKLKLSQWKGCDEAASVVAMIGAGTDSKFANIAQLEALEAQIVAYLGTLVRGEAFGEELEPEESEES